MWHQRPPPRPPGGYSVPSSGVFNIQNFSRPPPGLAAPRPPGPGLGPSVPPGVGPAPSFRPSFPPPPSMPAAAGSGPVPFGAPPDRSIPPLDRSMPPPGRSMPLPGFGAGEPRPPRLPTAALLPSGVGRPPVPSAPPRPGLLAPPGREQPPSAVGGPPQVTALPPGPPAAAHGPVPSPALPGSGAMGERGTEAGSSRGAMNSATERWLAAWAERSGVAARCSEEAAKKKTSKTLSSLQALSEAELARPETAAQLRRLVAQRRRRRSADRRRRQAERQRLQRKHADIDAWQAAIQRRAAREKEEEEMKREADKVLAEVRRKISDVEKQLETLDELRTLREVRDLKARAAGLFSSAASDQRFAEVTARLTDLLDRHLQTYETELRALQAMTAGPRPPPPPPPAAGGPLSVLRALFGAAGVSPAAAAAAAGGGSQSEETDHRIHMVDWEADPQTLLNIRSDWDRYLVGPEDPLGSAVPPAWVTPAPPSGDIWAGCLAA
ncbi:programmed cell death protein 7-like isoform X1 [Amphibalanus amphitrite]|uniref:programmed cell death protein 7-like isoform X1 n=1 Tax=Amphibalanus amphitrite TaxID=1232801 RepID=UPI001C924302|nr:programmed cell death protein 7-like isoform X1 [Amphibalanus amphitrite]XP_043203034.1 programmed cell death protein 7-like isoform X1 [Amphibalanus amphitrite]